MIASYSQPRTSYSQPRTCIPDKNATCHHLSGATWPVNYTQCRSMTVNAGQPLPDLRSTAAVNVSPVDINLINSSADEEGGTTVVGCKNDASIQKSNGLTTLEKEMETRLSNKTSPCETVKSIGYKKMTRSIRKDSSCQDS
ncbi:hypothetical protein Tco_1012437 [Tanacetum coccineum]